MMLGVDDPREQELQRTRARALRLLGRRAHSAYELREKLLRYHDENSADTAIVELLEDGYLNDADYAQNRAEYLSEQGKSARDIADRLRAAGVERQVIEEVLAQSSADETDKLMRVLRKGYLEKLRRGERESVMATMARRGFSQRDVLKALEELKPEYHEESE